MHKPPSPPPNSNSPTPTFTGLASLLTAWNAGSCALVAIVYRESGSDEFSIITGHCGDCRAVLCCRQRPEEGRESEMIEPNLSQVSVGGMENVLDDDIYKT